MVMHQYPSSYPVKIVSRTASLARIRKIRLSWLVASVAFGFGCTSALTPFFDNLEMVVAAKNETALAVASLKKAASLEDIVGAAPADIVPAETVIAQEVAKEKAAQKRTLEVAKNYPLSLDLKIQKGDTLVGLLTDVGVSSSEAKSAFETVRTVFNPRKLTAGSKVAVVLDKASDGSIIVRNLKLPSSALSTVELARTRDDDFIVKKTDTPLTKKLARAGGTIDSSIYQTGAEAGIPPAMLGEIINAYSYDVDFQRDIKKGNSIDVLFERMETKDGVAAGNGNLVYAELNLGNKVQKLYRYTDKNGNSDFYNEKGESVRKALLRTPISGARITSGFGMREHPLSGYTKMHKGVDFGAPTGTPIYAAGDGVVEVVRRENGYGNYLKIKHNTKYSSAYAHLSRYASGIKQGKFVKQGQIVAYVGSTGASTGPHLHYEILANNSQVNPANVKFKTGNVLAGKELLAFKGNQGKIESRLASIARGKTVAMVDEAVQKKATN